MIIKQITRLLLHGALAQMASRRHEQHTMFFFCFRFDRSGIVSVEL